MEIEIGESLALSYLKHVKRCVIYQTNWKLSSWWLQELGKKSPAEELYDQLKKSPSKEKTAATDFDVKDVLTSDFSQFLKQAEIDALGVDKDGNVYAIDVAFHERGLGYGKKNRCTRSCDEEICAVLYDNAGLLPRSKMHNHFCFPQGRCSKARSYYASP